VPISLIRVISVHFSLFVFHFSLMDTDDLSNETYEAVIIEAERFHHNLTLHFGVLAGQCDTEEKSLNFDLYDLYDYQD
jgi:hypothetical protein